MKNEFNNCKKGTVKACNKLLLSFHRTEEEQETTIIGKFGILNRWDGYIIGNIDIEHKYSLGPETGTLETVAVGCTTLATLLIIGLAVELSSKGSKCYCISSLKKIRTEHILYLIQPSHSYL